jgi:iron complex outermembrane receptor protein
VNSLISLAVDVPAKVNGVEAEFTYQPLPNWSIGTTLSYSIGEITNGVIPCNSAASKAAIQGLITAAQFVAANGGQQVASCVVNIRAGVNSPFSATLQSEYDHPIMDRFGGFIRGLLKINGYSQNDPLNPFDNIPAYALFDLFAGVRDPDGMWELTGYAKNLFSAQRVLSRDLNPAATAVQVLANGISEPTTYRPITVTAEREFGVNLRIAIGSD